MDNIPLTHWKIKCYERVNDWNLVAENVYTLHTHIHTIQNRERETGKRV